MTARAASLNTTASAGGNSQSRPRLGSPFTNVDRAASSPPHASMTTCYHRAQSPGTTDLRAPYRSRDSHIMRPDIASGAVLPEPPSSTNDLDVSRVPIRTLRPSRLHPHPITSRSFEGWGRRSPALPYDEGPTEHHNAQRWQRC